ncbi:MAG: polysaccharide biosynthesis/export family protein [Elusimicrobiota bacterium]
MLRRPSALLVLAVLVTGGCMLPHPSDPSADAPPETAASAPVQVSTAPVSAAAAAKEAAAIAAAMQQVVRAKTDYRLAPADLVSVTVYQDKDLDRKVRVNTNGTVSLPLIGSVAIGGLTLADAQARIETKFAQFLVSPQISLFIEDYGNKTIFVMGEVAKPGSYPIPTESRMTVLEAISTAGGFTPIAAQDRARVLRYVNGASVTYTINTKEITQQGSKDKDMVLEPNDIVYVPQSFF